jgi:hypothetical protein
MTVQKWNVDSTCRDVASMVTEVCFSWTSPPPHFRINYCCMYTVCLQDIWNLKYFFRYLCSIFVRIFFAVSSHSDLSFFHGLGPLACIKVKSLCLSTMPWSIVSGVIAPRILNLGSRQRRVMSFYLLQGKETPIPTEWPLELLQTWTGHNFRPQTWIESRLCSRNCTRPTIGSICSPVSSEFYIVWLFV